MTDHTSRGAAFLGCLLLSSVASAAAASSGWVQVQTEHVTLKTDLSLEQAERGVVLAERIRNALLAGAWPGAKLLQPERVEMIVFSDHSDFEGYFGDFLAGLFVHGDYPPTFILYGPPEKWQARLTLAREESTSVMRHEMAHHLAAFFFRRQPKWFSEGFAEYLETMRFSEDGSSVILGDINLDAVAGYNRTRSITVDDALAWGTTFNPQDQASVLGLYGLSWLMVHWLSNTHGAEYEKFQVLLNKGIDPLKAWKIVLPNMTSSDVAKELNVFVHDGNYSNRTVPIPEANIKVSERPMSSAEVHATKAFTWLVSGPKHIKEAMKELVAALADDPGNVRALRLQMGLVQPSERAALGRRATAAHPEDGLAWLTLAESLGEGTDSLTEREQANRKAILLLPDHPAAFNNMAWMLLQKGNAKEALPLAVTAMQLAPWDSAILDTLAAALAGVGRCSEAVPTQARALEMLGERSTEAQRAEYTQRLAALTKKCADLAAAAALLPPPVPTPAPAAKP